MKTLKLIAASLFLLVGLCWADPSPADSLILLSEEFPPYNYTENGELKGTSIDLMALILERMQK